MSNYTCPRCHYETNYRYNIRKHFMRNNKCPEKFDKTSIEKCFQTILFEEYPVIKKTTLNDFQMTSNDFEKTKEKDNLECVFCGKIFTRKNNLNMHIKKTCKKVKAHNISDKDMLIEKLKVENEMLRMEKKTLIQNNTITNNTTNNTIIINAFGHENLDYIKKEYVQALVKSGPYGSIQKLIKHIHFNPNHKENHNIKIPNKRDKYGMIFDGSKWLFKNKKSMITTIADHAYGIIAEHCEDLNNRKLDKFRDEYENEDSELMKRIADDTELVILNGQSELGMM